MAQRELKRILLIRPTALGDVCRTVCALVTLRQAHPNADIDWVVNEPFVGAIACHPALTRAVPFPRARFGTAWRSPGVAREAMRWVRDLRRRRYDAVFDLQGLARSGLITRFVGAPHRVGFADAREGAALAYNRAHAIDPAGHTVDRMLGLLEAEGYRRSNDLRLYASDDAIDRRRELFKEHHVDPDEPYACLAPTAQWLCKCWPAERFLAIARRLLDAAPGGVRRLVIVAAKHERAMIEPLLAGLEGDERVMVPQTSVAGLMAVIRDARLLVGNDSAPLHIAVGFARPIVAIFGPTNPRLVGPYGREGTVLRPEVADGDLGSYRRYRDDQTLIGRVSVADVWQRIEQTLTTDAVAIEK